MAFGKYATDFEERINYDRLRTERLQKAKDQIATDGLGAVVTFDADTIRYTTSHYVTTPLRASQMQFVVIPRNGDPVVYVAAVAEKLRARMPWMKGNVRPALRHTKTARTVDDLSRHVDEIGGVLAEHGLTNESLGIDGSTSEFLFAEAFAQKGIRCVDAKSTILEARKIKTRDEIELMKITCQNTELVFAAIKDAIRPGVRECDLVALGLKILYEQGCDHNEDLVCCSGENTNPFDLSFTDKPIQPGDLIYIDVDAASYQGYKPCVYRAFCCGRATAEQKEIYTEARDMLYAAIEIVKPGVTTLDICERWPTSASYWGYTTWEEVTPLAVGHGIGLSLHDLPFITLPEAQKNPVPLEEGMVIALETWAGKKGGRDGVRLEEDMIVTKDGYEIITKFPIDELIECWV